MCSRAEAKSLADCRQRLRERERDETAAKIVVYSCVARYPAMNVGGRTYAASTDDAVGSISASIRSAIRCAGSRSWLTVQSGVWAFVVEVFVVDVGRDEPRSRDGAAEPRHRL